jgi:hypothetical protein
MYSGMMAFCDLIHYEGFLLYAYALSSCGNGLLYLISLGSPPRFTFQKEEDANAGIEAQMRKETMKGF